VNLVVGSSGLLGGMIARKLLDRGQPVRVLVRRPSEIAGAEAVTGDLKDPRSLDAACRAVTTVITTANAAQRGGDDTIESVDLHGNRALIDAARLAGVRQFVFVSASTAAVSSPIPLFAAKARTERYLRDSGLEWSILAPHVFLDVWFPILVGSALAAGQPVSLVGGGRARHSFVAAPDVAEFAARVVGHPAATRRRLVLGGPEPLSWNDIAARTATILGRPLAVRRIEPGEPIPTLPSPLDRIAGLLAAGLEEHDVVIDMAEPTRTFGVSLTPVDTVLRQLVLGP
jgi:uncharacterized protein YbjT (DUF2867 family)